MEKSSLNIGVNHQGHKLKTTESSQMVMVMVQVLWQDGYRNILIRMLKVFGMIDFQKVGDQGQALRPWTSSNFLVVMEKEVQP